MLNSREKILLKREPQEKDSGTRTDDEQRGPFTVHNCVVCGQRISVVRRKAVGSRCLCCSVHCAAKKLQGERQEKDCSEREAKQRVERKRQEAAQRRGKENRESYLAGLGLFLGESAQQRQEKDRREREAKQRAERERQEAARRREKERQEKARREKETLLKGLRKRFEQEFLTAYDFYQAQCTAHISFKEYETKKNNYVRSWAKDYLNTNPDSEQAAAIGAIEGHVQVVARAGSGKTTTLVNRALFLQQHCDVKPDEMLLLAFNRKAAEEMRDRLDSDLQGSIPHAMTFHALAYALVHPEKIIFDEPEGEQSQSRALQEVIDSYRSDPNYYDKIRALMMAHFRADWERIIRPLAEMLRYRRSLPRESLDGKYVKSRGEKVIADFLFEHDIIYRYERNFWWNDHSYRPDFTIGDNRGIVIEYFGLEGDPDYDAMSEEKRNYWRDKPNWRLIELSPNDLRSNGVEGFYTLLKQKLEDCEIPCNRLSEEEIWHRIKVRAIDRFTTVITRFIQRCRKLSLTPNQLSDTVNNHGLRQRG